VHLAALAHKKSQKVLKINQERYLFHALTAIDNQPVTRIT
jgi:hypothetical protein